MYVCVRACVCSRVSIHVCVSVCLCPCLCPCVSVCVRVYVSLCVSTCGRVSVCRCVPLRVSLCVWHGAHVDMVGYSPMGIGFLCPLRGSQGSRSGRQPWGKGLKRLSRQCLVGASLLLQSAMATCFCAISNGFRCKNKNQ